MQITAWDGVSLTPPLEAEELSIGPGGKELTLDGRKFGVIDIKEAEGGYSGVAIAPDGKRYEFSYIPGE